MSSGIEAAIGSSKAIDKINEAVEEMLKEPCYEGVSPDEFAADMAHSFLIQEPWSNEVKQQVANWYGITWP